MNRPSQDALGAALADAAGRGQLEVVRSLLERGADPNAPEEGNAPHGRALYAAVYNKHFDVARLLLEHGANPNQEVESSADAPSIAIMNSDAKMIELLASLRSRLADSRAAGGFIAWAGHPGCRINKSPRPVSHGRWWCSLLTATSIPRQRSWRQTRRSPRILTPSRPPPAPGMSHSFASSCSIVRASWSASRWRPNRGQLTELLFQSGHESQPAPAGSASRRSIALPGRVTSKARRFFWTTAPTCMRATRSSAPRRWDTPPPPGKRHMVEFLLERGAQVTLPDDLVWATPIALATYRGHRAIVRVLKAHDRPLNHFADARLSRRSSTCRRCRSR